MQMAAERRLAAPRETIWTALNDVETLRRSIPGCETLEWVSDDTLQAEVRAKVGPVDTRFKGKVTLSERDPPNGYRIAGEGQGGGAGFAAGSAVVRLLPDGAGTLLKYDVEATVGGKLAQIGSRLINAAARKFADDFFARFADAVAPAVPAEPLAAAAPATRIGLRPAVWVPVLIIIVFSDDFPVRPSVIAASIERMGDTRQ